MQEKILQKLIQFPSVSPKDCGIFEYIETLLPNFSHDLKYFGENEQKTGNLYAKFGKSGRNFCFCGHIDVVHEGKAYKWRFEPYGGFLEDGIIYGRGAVDMKGSIACFIAAVSRFRQQNPDFNETISILLTADEEDSGQFGIKKMIKHIDEMGEKIDACVIGEPTSDEKIGDSIRIGRRGSVNFSVDFHGTAGHVAYPQKVENPITTLAFFMSAMKNHRFDEGNDAFEPTNLEFVDVSSSNEMKSTNVVPNKTSCMFNVRFNNLQSGEKIADFIYKTLEMIAGKGKFDIQYKISNESFFYGSNEISKIASDAADKITGNMPSLDCKGGTTDGRHIIKYCKNTCEIGLKNAMAHKIDEHVSCDDLQILTDIYLEILNIYFKK